MLKPVVFPADAWEHVCPQIRVMGPAEFNSMTILRGYEWDSAANGAPRLNLDLIQESDFVLIQRDFPARVQEYEQVMAEARRTGKMVCYEIDDLLPELPGRHSSVIRYHPSRLAILRALIEADVVTCTTPSLAEYIRTYNPRVHVLPNYLDDRFWKLRSIARLEDVTPNEGIVGHCDQPQTGKIVIGYLGSDSHMPDLAMVEPVLVKLLKRYGKKLEIKLWGMVPTDLLRVSGSVTWTQVGMVSYQQFSEYFQTQVCDIFIAPLVDNSFNRCKSPLKFFEYSALGIPGVYSNLAPYQMVVNPGMNGLLAATLEEWEQHLVSLVENRSLRHTIVKAAQETIQDAWLLSRNAGKWAQVYADEMSYWNNHQGEKSRNTDDSLQLAAEFAQKAQSWQIELADRLNERENEISRLRDHIHNLSKEITHLSVNLSSKEQAYLTANSLYQEIMNSTGWKVMQRLFRLRERIIPLGSRRESILRLFVFSLKVIRTEGLGAFLRGVSRRVKAKITGDRSPSASSQFNVFPSDAVFQSDAAPSSGQGNNLSPQPLQIQVSAGISQPMPAIDILFIHSNAGRWACEDIPELEETLSWLKRQTIFPNGIGSNGIGPNTIGPNAIEIIDWNLGDKTASRVDILSGKKLESWDSASFQELLPRLAGRYFCIAYRDLLKFPESYLEENYIAMETEALAFSVNLVGFPDWARNRITEGCLPGDNTLPLFRLVVSTTCAGKVKLEENGSDDGIELDLSAWITGRESIPNVIAKLIIHSSNNIDQYETLPFTARITVSAGGAAYAGAAGTSYSRSGSYLVSAPSQPGSPINKIARVIHPLDSVISTARIPSDKPTVILAMSYLAVGGAEQLALNIIERLRDKVRFIVLSTDEMDPSLGTMADAFRAITPYVYMTPGFLHPALNIDFVLYLVERFQPTAFYIANGASVLYDALEPLKRLHPQVRTMTQVFDYTEGWINRYDISLVTNLDAHIAPHARICQAYVEKGARPEKVFQVPAVVYVGKFQPEAYTEAQKEEIRLRLKLPKDRKIVTFASRMNAQKRPMDFVLLAQKFLHDPTVAFLMIGEGPEAEGVDLVISKNNVDNITRHKFYRPINDILAITDALVLPSSFEGMPLIIAETLSMGKPVVVTDVGNNREVIETTQGGVVVPQIGDIHALVEGVRHVLAHPPDPASLRKSVYENYSIEAGADLYYRIFLGATQPEESFKGQGKSAQQTTGELQCLRSPSSSHHTTTQPISRMP